MLDRLRARVALELPAAPVAIDHDARVVDPLRGMKMDNSFKQGLGLASTAYDAHDYRLAFQLYLRLAMQGCVPAQRWVALMLDFGEGCRKDQTVAACWYQMAAEQGDAQSQNNLGVNYAIGEGVRKDMATAAHWFRRAAQQGHAYAQSHLGRLYEHGEGVPRDWRRAVHWYRLSALQGRCEASAQLASLLARMAMAAE
jgi:TPR repeat protein